MIEVALPLDAINAAAAREKSIRHGHPSTLHLWWARRPLAAARAVLFAQMVDDPSEYVNVLLSDPSKKRAARQALKKRRAGEASGGPNRSSDRQALADMAAELERERLFGILEELVLWENTTNEQVLQQARAEIGQSWRRNKSNRLMLLRRRIKRNSPPRSPLASNSRSSCPRFRLSRVSVVQSSDSGFRS